EDFAAERALIHDEIVPAVSDLCRHYGLVFRLVDLRWGVTRLDVEEARTVPLCLEEVDACRRASPELNFLSLLGDRYGSRIVPSNLPWKQFTEMLRLLHARGEQILPAMLTDIYARSPSGRLAILKSDARASADAFARDPEVLYKLQALLDNEHIKDVA